MAPAKRARQRALKRTLVRWNDDLDELLLLTIQSVCNANGVRIPWHDVAETLGHNATEGAIVQHLAKLRIRRVQSNKEVPPPLRRAAGGPSGPFTKLHVKRGAPRSRGGQKTAVAPRKAAGRDIAKKRAHASSDSDSDLESQHEESSSDDKWSRRSRKKRDVRKHRGVSVKPAAVKYEPSVNENNDEGSDDGRSSKVELGGATFLQYPNDRELTDSPSDDEQRKQASPSDREPKSLLLKLKYRGRPLDNKPNIVVASPPASDGAVEATARTVADSDQPQWMKAPAQQQTAGPAEPLNQWSGVTSGGTHELAPEVLGEIESLIGNNFVNDMHHGIAGDIVSSHHMAPNSWSDFDGFNYLQQSDQDAESIARMYTIHSPFFELPQDNEAVFHQHRDPGLTLEYSYPDDF